MRSNFNLNDPVKLKGIASRSRFITIFVSILSLIIPAFIPITAHASPTFTEYPLPSASTFAEGVTTGPDGALWFTETGLNKIGRITTSGVITEFTLNTCTTVFNGNCAPAVIVSGPDGALWFTEDNVGRIGRITTGGAITEFLPISGKAPIGLTVGSDGALWFAEQGADRIGRITTDGAFADYASPANAPQFITSGPDGALWFTFNGGNSIGRITTGGVTASYPIPSPSNAAPVEITSGPDGALWFTELSANKIGQLKPDISNTLVQAINAGGAGSGSFVADTAYSGGAQYSSTASVDTSAVTNPAPQDVYQTVRYGNNFSYDVPNLAPNENVMVRLHFNELYWGTPLAGNGGGVGSRVFNVAINGDQVLSDFDIFQTAGGANKAIVVTFPASTDSTGNLSIHFNTIIDNAMVSGIEIVPAQ